MCQAFDLSQRSERKLARKLLRLALILDHTVRRREHLRGDRNVAHVEGAAGEMGSIERNSSASAIIDLASRIIE